MSTVTRSQGRQARRTPGGASVVPPPPPAREPAAVEPAPAEPRAWLLRRPLALVLLAVVAATAGVTHVLIARTVGTRGPVAVITDALAVAGETLLVVAGCGALGAVVVMVLLDDDDESAAARLRHVAATWAMLWGFALLYGQQVLWTGSADRLVGSGAGAVVAVVGAFLVALLAGRVTDRTSRLVLLGLALASLNAHLVAVHADHEGHHEGSLVGVVAVALHVAAMSLWVGGLLVLALHLTSAARGDVVLLQRFSKLALGCFVAVGVTGLVQVHDQGGLGQLLDSGAYGVVVALKVVLLVAIGGAGLTHRTVTISRLAAGRPGAFWALVAGELVLMALAAGLAVALGTVPTSGG